MVELAQRARGNDLEKEIKTFKDSIEKLTAGDLMPTRVLPYGPRFLTVSGVAQGHQVFSAKPVAALVPAYSEQDIGQAIAVVEALVENGCIELCCVGPMAEQLHDRVDGILESLGRGDVVTTFHHDDIDACEYFLFAANGATGNLLALVDASPQLLKALQAELDAAG